MSVKRSRNRVLIGDGEGGKSRVHLIWMRTAPSTRMLYFAFRWRTDPRPVQGWNPRSRWLRITIPPKGWSWGDVRAASFFIVAGLVLLAASIYVALTGGAY